MPATKRRQTAKKGRKTAGGKRKAAATPTKSARNASPRRKEQEGGLFAQLTSGLFGRMTPETANVIDASPFDAPGLFDRQPPKLPLDITIPIRDEDIISEEPDEA